MEIRLANKNDLDEIIKVEQECFPKEEAASAKEFQERFQTFQEHFVVACDEGKVIGFINGCVTLEASLPDDLYHNPSLHNQHGNYQTVFGLDVLPAYRNQGVAKALMDFFILLAKQRGYKGMVLTCKDHLIHYYEKFGFVHQGVSASQHGGACWNDMLLIFEK